ncbi:MAG: DUF3320 domain-containing protein [Chloroflexi bacterium]|nr:DUF3320 domain-containing protein [Chloroflexota bacterium]
MSTDAATSQPPSRRSRDGVAAALARWQAELLDLSRRNRLLYLTPGRGVLSLTHPTPDTLFEGLENQERRFRIYAPPDAVVTTAEQLDLVLSDEASKAPAASAITVKGVQRPGAAASARSVLDPAGPRPPSRLPHADEIVIEGEPKRVDAALYRLRQRARTALVEQGTNVLFVTFGTLEWREAGAVGPLIRSPLLLVPVMLERATALDPYTLAPLDDTLVLNPALVRKLAVDLNLPLTLPDTEDDLSLAAVLDHIRRAVAGRPDWSVHTDVYLGLFSFAKYAMYADLDAQRERLLTHPLVRAIAGADDGLPPVIDNLPTAETLDETVRPADVFQVLDADASQQEAIAAVTAGASLVIQGPPGTGKSQTIANIIAETLAQGKTVLFVSEKMAALRVVAKRLAEAGLREFCLEAHSQDVNKAAVIKELRQTLEAGRVAPADTSGLALEQLADRRRQLRAYVAALHDAANPLGYSAFRVHGERATREGAPAVAFEIADIATLTEPRLAAYLGTVQELTRVGEVLLGAATHPWRGCLITVFTPQVQSDLDSRFRSLSAAAAALAAGQAAMRARWGLPPADSLRAAEWLADLLALLDARVPAPLDWLRLPDLAPLVTTAAAHQRRLVDYHQRRAALLTRYSANVFQLDLPAVQATLVAGGGAAARRLRGDGAPADRAVVGQAAIVAAGGRAAAAAEALGVTGDALATQLALPASRSLAQSRRLQSIATLVAADQRPQRTWFAPGQLASIEDLVEQARRRQEVVTTNQAELEAQFVEEFFIDATADLAARFDSEYAAWWRVFRPGYHRDLGRLRRRLRTAGPFDYAAAVTALTKARRLATARTWLDERQDHLAASLGHHFAGPRTDWVAVAGAVAMAGELIAHLDGQTPPAPLLDLLATSTASVRPAARAFDAALAEAERALAAVTALASLDTIGARGLTPDDVPLAELAAALRGWLSDLEPLWTAVAAMGATRTDRRAPVAALAHDAGDAVAVRQTELALAAADAELRVTFGHLFAGLETRWDEVLVALAWTGQLRQHLGISASDSFIAALAAHTTPVSPERDRLTAGITAVSQILAELQAQFTDTAFRAAGLPLTDAPLPAVSAWAGQLQAALPQLEEWIDLAQALVAADRLGLASFVAGLQRERPPRERWADAFQRRLWTLWLTWRYEQAPALAQFRGQRHEDIITEFRRLDREQWPAAARRIAQRLVQRRPLLSPSLPPRSEPALLMKEASKKRRFRPLRRLFADLPIVLPALKPCLLMSPLSVAQFLGESALTFDLVVFDEASQILPADAIGAIGRGHQLVVVGDQQQLPPTRFFSIDLASTTEAEDDEEMPESVLDACLAARLPQKPLRWHYRSRHEHLIAFSNRWFYDRRLITFPSPDEHVRAVRLIHVEDGIYDRAVSRMNRAEARRIADLVVEHVEQQPDRSLGVIAFSQPQMEAIHLEIDARKRARPELEPLLSEAGLEGFFVKNLENVQGDERDVILFSVGYGPDAAGQMTMNFGPLNLQGGERRLNVAITRARERVTMLASFRPHAIDLSRTQAKGVHLLRRYLEFAEQGPVALLSEITTEGGEPESPFEQAVADALTERGLRVVAQVGVGGYRIDLGVRDDGSDRYLLGIECDGATYHASRTARDRDRLRQQVLEQLGWRIHRIWSTDWLKNPAQEVERVLAAVARARAVPPPASPLPTPISPATAAPLEPASTPAPPSAPAPATIARPYIVATLGQSGDSTVFRTAPIATLAQRVQAVATVEGPVHEDRVMSVVAASYGIKRVGRQVRDRVAAAIARAARDGLVDRRGAFLWPPGLTTPVVRAADAAGVVRPIGEVASEEIAAGVTAYLTHAFALSRADLVTGVARELGYDRTGAHVAAAIEAALDQLLAGGTVRDVGGQVRLAD